MPKGIPKKREAVEAVNPSEVLVERPAVVNSPDFTATVKSNVPVEAPKAPAKPVVEPLGTGLKYFETPEGTLHVGEVDADRLWVRSMNGGRGGWCNPKR